MRRYEEQDSDDGIRYCNDPTHDEDCGCGADPDRHYEKQLVAKIRRGEW